MTDINNTTTTTTTTAKKIPGPITLSPPGKREVVTKERALEIIAHWREQLLAHRTEVVASADAAANALPLCDRIVLADKSYKIEAATEIASFLTSTEEFNPSIASGITVADVSDVIASRMEIEGLQVLTSLSNAFSSSKLIEVNLSDNAMGSKGITACANLLGGPASIDSLERLSLCNNGLSEASMEEIAQILTKRSPDNGSSPTCIAARLTKIHFFNNMSGDGGCASFGKILDNCSSRLEDVRFSGTRAGAKGSRIVAEALEGLASSSDGGGSPVGVTRLDLADNSFGSCGATLARAVTRCPGLVHVNFKDCVLSESGLRSVCSALTGAGCPLVHLDLSGNEILPDVVGSVAALLEDDTVGDSIRYLGMEECEMTSIGVRRIAKALASTGGGGSSLEEINLECNECGRIGAAALIDSVGTGGLPNLKCIRLDRNMFPSESMDALATAFGDKMVEMEENDDEDDVDDDLEVEDGGDVDELADVLGKTSV